MGRGEDLNGEEVVVLNEQGLGDTVQFTRFAQGIVARGKRRAFEVPQSHAPLIVQADNVRRVIREGKAFPETGLHIPMFDLLSIFAGHLGGQCALYRRRSGQGRAVVGPNSETERKRIGLVWAGRPTHRNDRNRSVKLEAFLPLLFLKDFDFYSLQVGDHTADIEEAGLSSDLIDLSPRLTDFSETAAVHVAGALGRPVWALNSIRAKLAMGPRGRRDGVVSKRTTLAAARAPRLGKRYRTAVRCAGATGKEKRAPEKLVRRPSKICRLQLKTKAPPIRKYRRLYRGV